MRHLTLKILFVLASLLSSACIGPFAGRKTPPFTGPPALAVEFNSLAATAHLAWQQAPKRNFLYYQLLRISGADTTQLARIDASTDTSLILEGLGANTLYRYQLAAHFGKEDEILQSYRSRTVEGGIHLFERAWSLPSGFLPTRLAIDQKGIITVVGAGTGRLARFNQKGQPLGEELFTDNPLARLETGALDGPVLAHDSAQNLYIAYNIQEPGSSPKAFWSKIDPRGKTLWTQPLGVLFVRHLAIDQNDRIFIESISQLHQFDPQGELVARYTIPALLVSSLRFWKGSFAALLEPLHLADVGWQAPRLVVYEGLERSQTALVIGRDPQSEDDKGNGLLRRPTDFVVDEKADRVFIVNAGRSRIVVFSNGKFLTNWGRKGDQTGQFHFSGQALVIDNIVEGTTARRQVAAGGIGRDARGFLYVADTFNDRIQQFRP
ncbi:MAG: hypothetical protein GKR89_29760 [Candidatus Latescibacteria bacterium]|nr:hypothetical protein [Candidatus Latescibacterota bacterium]